MIIYNHLALYLRLFQYKGTVLQDTSAHVLGVNVMVFFVWVFFTALESHPQQTQILDATGAVSSLVVDEGTSSSTRPDWLPGPWNLGEVSPLAWQLLMLPLGFLLGLRSNQAYDRYLAGVDSYTSLIQAAAELSRQVSSYVRMDVSKGAGGGGGAEPVWEYRNVPAGTQPPPGEEDYQDEQKERLFRHVLAFVALVRQDIRNRRLENIGSEADQRERATEERLHVTQQEMDYLIACNAYEEETNAPLMVARWLSHDVAALSHRVGHGPIVAAMEANIGKMVEAFTTIDKISEHPVPWPCECRLSAPGIRPAI